MTTATSMRPAPIGLSHAIVVAPITEGFTPAPSRNEALQHFVRLQTARDPALSTHARGILTLMRNQPRARRAPRSFRRFLVVCTLALLLAACGGGGGNSAGATGPAIRVDDLPAGVGRGFPLASVEQERASPERLSIGEAAPNFFMTTADGRTLTLDSLRGRPVVINHWATWCGPCRLEMPEIIKAARENPDLVVIAANHMEGAANVEAFAREFDMTVPVVLDTEGRLSELFAVRAFPTTQFIDREGRLAAEWIGLLTPDRLQELLAGVL